MKGERMACILCEKELTTSLEHLASVCQQCAEKNAITDDTVMSAARMVGRLAIHLAQLSQATAALTVYLRVLGNEKVIRAIDDASDELTAS